MPTPKEIEEKFWSALKSDMTMMLGLDGVEDGHARPMTAQLDGERGPIWFFTSRDNAIVEKLGAGQGNRAISTFTAKGHDLFATVHGGLSLDNNPATIDRFYMNNAHNDYLQLALEGGLPAVLLIVVGISWIVVRTKAIWQDRSADPFAQAATIATATILAHSLVDYPLRTAAVSTR